jgi:hypothetical protein
MRLVVESDQRDVKEATPWSTSTIAAPGAIAICVYQTCSGCLSSTNGRQPAANALSAGVDFCHGTNYRRSGDSSPATPCSLAAILSTLRPLTPTPSRIPTAIGGLQAKTKQTKFPVFADYLSEIPSRSNAFTLDDRSYYDGSRNVVVGRAHVSLLVAARTARAG